MNRIENKKRIRNIALNGVMLALVVALQAVNLPNIITGIIVNAILVFILLFVGIRSALTLSLLTPLCGFITGHVNALLYPVIPAIILGNVLFVFIIYKLKEKSLWLKIFIPSFVKALIISAGGKALIYLFIPNEIEAFVLYSFLGIQFFTAVPGVLLGYKLSKSIKAN